MEQNANSIVNQNLSEIDFRLKKSFTAKLMQLPTDAKIRYSELKNVLLTLDKVSDRISWNYESFSKSRTHLAKFAVYGKTLYLYLALNPDKYVDTKYKVKRADNKRFETVPCLYKITSNRKMKYAVQLIKELAEENEIKVTENKNIDYTVTLPYEENDALIEKGLIKRIYRKENEVLDANSDFEAEEGEENTDVEVVLNETVVAEEPAEAPVEEVAPVEETVEETSVEESTEEAVEENNEEVTEETTEESVEETAEEQEATEEVAEEPKDKVTGFKKYFTKEFLNQTVNPFIAWGCYIGTLLIVFIICCIVF